MARKIRFVEAVENADPNNLMQELWYDNKCITVNDFVDWATLSGEVVTYSIHELEDDAE